MKSGSHPNQTRPDPSRAEPEHGSEMVADEAVAEEERQIDRTLADSFPASDPPPWTLGVRESTETKR